MDIIDYDTIEDLLLEDAPEDFGDAISVEEIRRITAEEYAA